MTRNSYKNEITQTVGIEKPTGASESSTPVGRAYTPGPAIIKPPGETGGFVFTADHGEWLQREGGPGTVSQQVFETLKNDSARRG
jgi:hypothetical protein